MYTYIILIHIFDFLHLLNFLIVILGITIWIWIIISSLFFYISCLYFRRIASLTFWTFAIIFIVTAVVGIFITLPLCIFSIFLIVFWAFFLIIIEFLFRVIVLTSFFSIISSHKISFIRVIFFWLIEIISRLEWTLIRFSQIVILIFFLINDSFALFWVRFYIVVISSCFFLQSIFKFLFWIFSFSCDFNEFVFLLNYFKIWLLILLFCLRKMFSLLLLANIRINLIFIFLIFLSLILRLFGWFLFKMNFNLFWNFIIILFAFSVF